MTTTDFTPTTMWMTNSSHYQPTFPDCAIANLGDCEISSEAREERKRVRQSSVCALIIFLTMVNCLPTSLIFADASVSASVMALCALLSVVAIFGVCLRKLMPLFLALLIKLFYSAMLLLVSLETWLGDPTLVSNLLDQVSHRSSWPVAIAVSQATIAIELCFLAKEAQRITRESNERDHNRHHFWSQHSVESSPGKARDLPPSYVTVTAHDDALPSYREAIHKLRQETFTT